MRIYDNKGSLVVDYGLHASEHEVAGSDEVSLGALSGSITDAQHGARTQANAHAHSHLSGIGANDHHAQAHTLGSHSTKAHNELTGVGANDHHAQAHAASHGAGGADQLSAQLIEARTTDPATPPNGRIWLRTDL